MEGVATATRFSWGRLAWWLLILVASAAFAWWAQPYYSGNSAAIGVLGTAFSVLAGFLIAVLTITGERSPRGRTWRQDAAALMMAGRDLRYQRSLFHLYLVVLALTFVSALGLPEHLQGGKVAVDRGTLFLASFGGFLSLRLPSILTRRYQDRLRAEVLAARKEELDNVRRG